LITKKSHRVDFAIDPKKINVVYVSLVHILISISRKLSRIISNTHFM
jgi:hypothetical protein